MILTVFAIIYHLVKKKTTESDKSNGTMSSWGYDKDNGPDTWPLTFLVGNGPRQSPVDIDRSKVVVDKSLTPLTINWVEEKDLEIENPGLSFKIPISCDSVISGGPLADAKYKLVQFHFHWAHDDKEGSEHRIDGKMYASELHFVHYNADKYSSFGDAVTQSDGLAVIGVFINVGDENAGFKTLSDNISQVKCKDSKVKTGVKFNPASLLPANISDYWTYDGSLTTPPLCESVTWIVLKDTISISKDQMDAMRSLSCDDCGSKPIPANYRPPQPLGTRKIKANFCD